MKEIELKGSTGVPEEYKFKRSGAWIKEQCSKIISDDKIIDFLADVATGRYQEERFFAWKGRIESRTLPAELSIRIKCAEILLDRGFGKAIQNVGSVDENGSQISYPIILHSVQDFLKELHYDNS